MKHATTIATSAVTAFMTVAALAWLGSRQSDCAANCTVVYQSELGGGDALISALKGE
jgi:hypothetical protein